MVATRAHLHRLVDELSPRGLAAAARYLEFLRAAGQVELPPELANAPPDDEPTTPGEEAAVAEGWKDVAEGRIVSHDEVRRRLGLNR